MATSNIGIIGAGAWGTALAIAARAAGFKPMLWAFEKEIVQAINEKHENTGFLPGIALDPEISASNDLASMAQFDTLLVVTPAQHTRTILEKLGPSIQPGCLMVMCSKGIEQGTQKFMSQILGETIPQAEPAILSGPSFAADVARGLPTAVTIAGPNLELIETFSKNFKSKIIRPYFSDDMIGAQIGGALKNVLAIACGIVEGRKFGASAKAAVIARGFAELNHLGLALGAKETTLRGLSGLGDLVLTCSSSQSRNMSLGLALGSGKTLDEILSARQSVTEGVHTAQVVIDIARKHDLDMPICECVHSIIGEGADIDQVIEDLLNRPISLEN